VSDSIRISIVGGELLERYFGDLPADMRAAMAGKLEQLAVEVKDEVFRRLSGPVLNVVSGTLRGSLEHRVVNDSTEINANVEAGDGVVYAKIHEYGGWIYGGLSANSGSIPRGPAKGGRRALNLPERSYMRSTLNDMRAYIIGRVKADFIAAVMSNFRAKLGGL
jgi:phage gpG-like protein